MFSQADYEVKVVDGVLVIFDLDLGNKSVTNDIENVLADLAAKVELGNRPIIYRDSTGTFDGVNQECGRFIGFYSLGAENMYGAVRRVQALQRQAG